VEILVAAVVYVGLLYGLGAIVVRTITDPVLMGLALGALSGLIGLAAFYAAFAVRIRSHAAFGVRRTTWKWLLLGVALGIAAVILTRLGVILFALLGGDVTAADPQGDYRAASNGGPLAFALSILFLAVLTPIGEEFAFRGVLMSGLRRYGAWVSIVVSTIVFALAHGINLALIPAVVVGGIAAILYWRSGSVWPGVVVHAVNNGTGVSLALLAGSFA
jgi:uncharacterized protein